MLRKVNHVAQHTMLRNMIDRVWAPLERRKVNQTHTYGTLAQK
jgi:hypothetical protein